MGATAWAPPASADWTAKRLPYGDTYDPPLTHYHLERETRWRLIGAGTVVFGIAYVLSVVSAAENNFRDGSAMLLIPVAGPMIAAERVAHSKWQCGFTPPSVPSTYDCNSGFFFVSLVADAVVQVTGAGLLASGLVFRRKVWVRDAGFTLLPTVGVANGPHVGIRGAF